MKIKDKFRKLEDELGQENAGMFLNLTTLGTIFNILEEGIQELGDEDIQLKFKELLDLVLDKREALGEKELDVKLEKAE